MSPPGWPWTPGLKLSSCFSSSPTVAETTGVHHHAQHCTLLIVFYNCLIEDYQPQSHWRIKTDLLKQCFSVLGWPGLYCIIISTRTKGGDISTVLVVATAGQWLEHSPVMQSLTAVPFWCCWLSRLPAPPAGRGVLLTPHCSLFQVAVLNNHEQLVQLLLDKGADPSVKNEVNKLYWRFSFGGEYNTRI